MEIKFFYCAYCEYKTKRKYDLNRHQTAIHYKNILNEFKEDNNIHFQDNNIHFQDNNIHFQDNNIHLQDNNIHLQDNNKECIIYNCKKCNKQYKTKKYLLNHEKSCNGLNIKTCPRCMKTFSHVNNKNKHIKLNNCKARSIIYYDNPNNKHDFIINGNNNNITNNITNNIINNYGSERTDYITLDDIINIFLKGGDYIIPKYIEFKHYNKNFPEKHNIKYEKNKGCYIKNIDKWSFSDLDFLSNNLLNKNSEELKSYYNNEYIKERLIKLEILEFVNSRLNYLDLYINTKLYNNIKSEIKNIIKSNIII